MNEKGNLYIPRIWLVIGIISIILIVIGITAISIKLFKTNEKQKNEIENLDGIIQNEVGNQEQIDYTKLDEGIALVELPKVERNIIAEQNSTIDGRIPCFYNPVIPEGFKAIGNEEDKTIDEKAKWGQQNAYLYGLVIEDKKGNQFVWVPVENMEIFKRTDWQKNAPKETIDENYIEPIEDEEEDYYKMYYKVKKYGGFYIGRYETGDITSTVERAAVKNSDSIGIKKYLNAYNYVPYSISTINKREITGAEELSINFAKQNGYKTVKTSVVYGVQWDAMLRFIVSDVNNVNNSIRWGNYSSSELNYTDEKGNKYVKETGEVRLLKTGASEETKAKNIYDIAGNTYEWTKETTRNGVRIVRGGSYAISIGQLAASRYAYNSSTANNAIGFRISFYID